MEGGGVGEKRKSCVLLVRVSSVVDTADKENRVDDGSKRHEDV